MKKIITPIFLLLIFLTPLIRVEAQGTNDGVPELKYSIFVKCDGIVRQDGSEPYRQTPCNLAALMETVIKLVNWGFYISVPLATALFAYAGLLYMTGQKGRIDTAKKIFSSVAIGFIIMTTAWIAVRTAVDWVVRPDSGATTFVK